MADRDRLWNELNRLLLTRSFTGPQAAAARKAIEDDIRADAIDRLMPYVHHNPTTNNGEGVPGSPCTCGLAELLAELRGTAK